MNNKEKRPEYYVAIISMLLFYIINYFAPQNVNILEFLKGALIGIAIINFIMVVLPKQRYDNLKAFKQKLFFKQ